MSQTGQEAFTLDELLERIDLREIVRHRWGSGTQQGDAVRYRSRWERDAGDDSFVVYRDRYEDQSGTGETGNAVSWVKRELTLSLSEAQRWLQDRYDRTNAAGLSCLQTNGGDLDQTCDNPWWPRGVPDAWRTALLRFFPGSTALVVEIANAAFSQGLCDPSGFTRSELLTAAHSLGFAVGKSTLADTMKRMDGIFFQKLTLINNIKVNSQKNLPRRRGGRRPLVVCACALRDIEQHVLDWARPRIREDYYVCDGPYARLAHFDSETLEVLGLSHETATSASKELDQLLKDFQPRKNESKADAWLSQFVRSLGVTTSNPLPDDLAIKRTSDYRAAFLRAWFNVADDPRIENWKLRVMLGCSRNTVRDTVKRAGLKAVPQFEDVEIYPIEDIERQVKARARKHRGRPVSIIYSDDPMDVLNYGSADGDRYIESLRASDLPVTIRFRKVNLYQIDPSPRTDKSVKALKKRDRESGAGMPGRTVQTYGPGLSQNWVAGQLKLALDLLQYRRGFDFINPATGQIAGTEASPIELLEILLGRPVN